MKKIRLFCVVLPLAMLMGVCLVSCEENEEMEIQLEPRRPEVRIKLIEDKKITMPVQIFMGGNPEAMMKKVPSGEAPSAINVLLLCVDGKYALIDAGLGAPDSSLMPELARNNVKPEDIKAVILTHTHYDHVGGLLDREGKRVFHHAKVYLSHQELDFARSQPANSPQNVMAKVLAVYGQDVCVFRNNAEVIPGIKTIPAEGHTPGHTIFELGDSDVFVGDIIHAIILQLNNPEICANFDMNPGQSIETRKQVLQRYKGKKNIIGAHVPDGVIYSKSTVTYTSFGD